MRRHRHNGAGDHPTEVLAHHEKEEHLRRQHRIVITEPTVYVRRGQRRTHPQYTRRIQSARIG
jgi:hypothetical protein